LKLNVTNSNDVDNSEFLSIRITVPDANGAKIGTIGGSPPAGVTITLKAPGMYLIEASGSTWNAIQAKLNSFVDSGNLLFFPRANWAGRAQLKVDVISTEKAATAEIASGAYGGVDNDSRTETTTQYISIVVNPIADVPVVANVKGNALGFEDEPIQIAVSVTLGDNDGSENYVMEVVQSSLPAGCKINGAGFREISPVNGIYTLNPGDVDEFYVTAPLHYSTAYQGNITMSTR